MAQSQSSTRIPVIMNDGQERGDPAVEPSPIRTRPGAKKIEPEVRPAQRRDEPRARSSIKQTGRGGDSRLVGLLLGNQTTHSLGEQSTIERFLEGVVEAE
ncbi:hypothetical protein Sinac_2667 [Singulisphaera acidiphila DSM 18658]|uniref:Uncharacterized protein n=1 Tax=Singulisphaera acidiphila (strain ATCC BAA-1392 / DSM 18658 / VKM B-2454 / MOB10) TaxID=886293 RepID=L0DDR6_SINAD|nr:hypothetical protein Sinac_2667 [Singulisphaera acidiphila DSM 18658]